MAELNLADRPWSMCSQMLCNFMHSWWLAHSISALASGAGGCKVQCQSHPSRNLVSACSLVLLKTDCFILCSSSYPPSLPTFMAALFLLPALQNYWQVVGTCPDPFQSTAVRTAYFLSAADAAVNLDFTLCIMNV